MKNKDKLNGLTELWLFPLFRPIVPRTTKGRIFSTEFHFRNILVFHDRRVCLIREIHRYVMRRSFFLTIEHITANPLSSSKMNCHVAPIITRVFDGLAQGCLGICRQSMSFPRRWMTAGRLRITHARRVTSAELLRFIEEDALGKQPNRIYPRLGKSVALTVPKNPPQVPKVSLTAEAS